jgi:Sec-independent protein translocase protein TatA
MSLFFVNCCVLKNNSSFIGESALKNINRKSYSSYKNLSYKNRMTSYRKGVFETKALLGPSGGFFGVGSSEVLVIGAVAYFILGPKRLYQLARDIGRITAEFKNVTDEARMTFQKAVDTDIKGPSQTDKVVETKKSKNSIESSGSKIASLDNIIDSEISNIQKK